MGQLFLEPQQATLVASSKLWLVNGWGHDRPAIAPLADRLDEHFEVQTFSPSEFGEGQPLERKPEQNQRPETQQSVVLVGWSMGGMLAMQRAALEPRSVAALVLISSMRRFCISDDYPEGVPAANLRALSIGCRRRTIPTLEGFYEQAAWPQETQTEHDPRQQRAQRVAADHSIDLQQGLDYLRQADLSDTIADLSVPTLILHGRDDAVVSLAAADDLRARIANSELHIRDGIGHDLPLRDPAWVTQTILAFWTQHVASR
jgi:pimeloyl-[acyl-carrier protein] methyl ester esterase